VACPSIKEVVGLNPVTLVGQKNEICCKADQTFKTNEKNVFKQNALLKVTKLLIIPQVPNSFLASKVTLLQVTMQSVPPHP